MNAPPRYAIARQSAGPAPLRRPDSIRRTTSIDVRWPQGKDQPMAMEGRARDLLTRRDGSAEALDSARVRFVASPRREIVSIDAEPAVPAVQSLVGVRAGGASRTAIVEAMAAMSDTPLYQLLDDFAGASLVAPWTWWLWQGGPRAERDAAAGGSDSPRAMTPMVDVCTGLAAGASSLTPEGTPDAATQSRTEVGSLIRPDDPDGWHAMPDWPGPAFRRARRIDLWREGAAVIVDAGFQDSAVNPAGGRTAVHEYRVHARLDGDDGVLTALEVLPLILPYRECPGASAKASAMIGVAVAEFRESVLTMLAGTAGCTHLNDVLRALAPVPQLARNLV